MQGKVKKVNGELQLVLTADNRQEKKWLYNAFYCIKVGCLNSEERDVKSLVLWTDDTRKLPRPYPVPKPIAILDNKPTEGSP